MRFPLKVRHRRESATIYAKDSRGSYRVCWYAAGQRRVGYFKVLTEARAEAERVVRELARGEAAPTLTSKEARDSLAIRDVLEGFHRRTGLVVTALEAVSQYCEAATKLGDRSLAVAVDGFLATNAAVRRVNLDEAVREFIEARAAKAESRNGERARLSPTYAGNVARWLTSFADALKGLAVCDLGKDHIGLWMEAFSELGAKARNDRRAALGMFFRWCGRRDYLPPGNRLLDAEGMQREDWQPEDLDFYRPGELKALFDAAPADVKPVLAVQAFGGLRAEEALRLTWRAIFGGDGEHIEVGSSTSKTRSRRLVSIRPVLRAWLEAFRSRPLDEKLWLGPRDAWFRAFEGVREAAAVKLRRNGLRHGFATHAYAESKDEVRVASELGNAPAVFVRHYRGLVTEKQGRAWFAVEPQAPANVLPLVAGGAQ